jgi:ribosomal-protein-alanine N-acetyltransferase
MIIPAGVADGTLDSLWHALCNSLHEQGVNEVAVLALDEWVEPLIAKWGFKVSTAVVTMRRVQGPQPAQSEPPLRIRPASAADMTTIAQLDASAFGKLWHYNEAMLRFAQLHAATFTVLENAERILGYQLSTAHAKNGHLARLAVTPDVQGQGLGELLLGSMIRHFEQRDMTTLTVNTQEDNTRSQRLYKRFGFDYVGFKVPVWTVPI